MSWTKTGNLNTVNIFFILAYPVLFLWGGKGLVSGLLPANTLKK
jgi:hypothetical protein